MLTILRHLLSLLLLPFLVVIVVPYSLIGSFPAAWSNNSPALWLLLAGGVILLLTGLLLFSWCVILFARVGRGTLAPWDPTENLVASGPYRNVRNPMIGGVALILFGEALVWGSWAVALWAVFFLGLNHTYFILLEEPGLERRFGESYRAYKTNVPRWIPRRKPWRPSN